MMHWNDDDERRGDLPPAGIWRVFASCLTILAVWLFIFWALVEAGYLAWR